MRQTWKVSTEPIVQADHDRHSDRHETRQGADVAQQARTAHRPRILFGEQTSVVLDHVVEFTAARISRSVRRRDRTPGSDGRQPALTLRRWSPCGPATGVKEPSARRSSRDAAIAAPNLLLAIERMPGAEAPPGCMDNAAAAGHVRIGSSHLNKHDVPPPRAANFSCQPARQARPSVARSGARGRGRSCFEWCGWPGSNRHSLRNRILSPARLPVSPHPHGADPYVQCARG